MAKRSTFALFAVLTAASACKETPSWALRWTLDGEDLERSVQCSERGVLLVGALTYDVRGFLVDERIFPCFAPGFDDPDALVKGPELAPGAYVVKVLGAKRGLRAWIDQATLQQEIFAAQTQGKVYESDLEFQRCRAVVDDPACRNEELVCDCHHLDVVSDETVVLPTYALRSPPQCADGIDNDHDGLTDENDPACRGGEFSNDTLESRAVSASEFDVRISFLDHHPSIRCAALGISRLEVAVGDEVLAATNLCDTRLRFSAILAEALGDGPPVDGQLPITLTIRARSASGADVAEPIDVPLSVPLDIGGFFVLQVDFGGERFFEPIVAPARFVLGFSPYEGAPSRGCTPATAPGDLAITDVRITWLDAHGRPLDPPVVTDTGDVLDGTLMSCPGGAIRTPALTWGDYLVVAEGLSARGDVCFSNADAPTRAAPSETFAIVLPRVSSSGSCRDCQGDVDCGPSYACEDGVCRLQ